jgi:hypothetical protein
MSGRAGTRSSWPGRFLAGPRTGRRGCRSALNLWHRAIWATTEAMLAARRMRDAVTVELEDAWMVLNR